MVVAEKLRMHVQKIIRLIQRRREPQWGHVLKATMCGRDKCAGTEVENRRWKTRDGGGKIGGDREKENTKKKRRRKMQIDPRARKELILPPRRNCLRNVFANGKRRGGGIAFAVRN